MQTKTHSTAVQRGASPVASGALVRRFGTFVYHRRLALGMTGQECARRAGLGKGHLSKIENHGENVSLETIEKLSHALEVRPSQLMAAVELASSPNAEVSDAGRSTPKSKGRANRHSLD